MGQAQMSKNSGFWEILQLEIHSKNYMLNFFHAKYLLKYSFLMIQQFEFIIFLYSKLLLKIVVNTLFHASWQCAVHKRNPTLLTPNRSPEIKLNICQGKFAING